MSPRQVDLALRKQRLQLRSAALRGQFSTHAASWRPAFALADRGRAALGWLRRHPAVPVAFLVALLAARPRTLLCWFRRGFVTWQAFRKLGGLLSRVTPLVR